MTTAIALGVIALIFASFSIFVLTVLYRRGLAIRRKRAMRRYMMSGESFEPLEDKGTKFEPRILKPTELRKIKLLGNGVFGSVHKGVWIPEGDTVKLPVAIKTIHDRSGRQIFCKVTDHMRTMASLNHINVVRTLGICPGDSLQLVTPLNRQGSLLEHIKKYKSKLSPQRLLNWCVQIAKGMNYLEENRMVHRNLAARNVLLNDNFTAQVSDYGIADSLYSDDKKYFYNELKTPIKWMALESILFRRYTHQSDVWSYGVTVWEMMSYGAEPYATMRPQEVPDLLEKGERLPQPQICTIDVYMVMVKCWMIDENVRPTFKELGSEFTRMARDPPRYLVIKEDCSQQDSSPDELVQRSADLDDLDDVDVDLEDPLADGVGDDLAPVNHYVTKSLTRNSRIDTHKVVLNPSSGAGYLPMTSGVDSHAQTMWQSRSRLNSARTLSETSEGCGGTALELEMGEDFPLAGSPKRRRHREDSAYISQRDSMSGGPPETPSPEMEEEDQNGYVLPGGSPERDTLLYSSRATPGRMGKSRSSDLLDYPDDDEYEYMNKQVSLTPVLPRQSSHWLKPNKKRTSSVSSRVTASSCDTAVSVEVKGGHTRSKDNSDSEQQGYSEAEYEYMDIRGSEKPEGPPGRDPPPPPTPARMRGKPAEEDEYVEDSNYHYTNRQPKLRQALQDKKELNVQGTEAYEYEDMDCFSASPPEDAAVYQNIQREQKGAVGGREQYQSGFDPSVKVRAGSFDNPGYWHSRMFLKPNAVQT